MDHNLARRLVAAYPDVWAPRMRYLYESDVAGGIAGGTVLAGGRRLDDHSDRVTVLRARGCWPDLGDPATAGVLLARLPSSWTCEHDAGTVIIYAFTGAGTVSGRGPTLGHACAAALVALTTPTPPAAPGEE